jgi:cytidylate kinase
MTTQIHDDPRIVATVERQMHLRAMAMESQDRADRHRGDPQRVFRNLQHVAISREAGAGGSEIGRAVGQRLGWTVYDANLLDQIAERFHVSRMMLDVVDETHSNWVYDVLGTWMDRQIVPHEKYVVFLERAILEASKRGSAVFIGRAAQFLLPRLHLLAVRIVASESYRVRKIMERKSINEIAARRWVHDMDKGRREFVLRFFHHDVADPHHYDLVINVERCGPEDAVQRIVAALSPPVLAHA